MTWSSKPANHLKSFEVKTEAHVIVLINSNRQSLTQKETIQNVSFTRKIRANDFRLTNSMTISVIFRCALKPKCAHRLNVWLCNINGICWRQNFTTLCQHTKLTIISCLALKGSGNDDICRHWCSVMWKQVKESQSQDTQREGEELPRAML